MTELLTAAQMRAIEGAAIESGRVTGLDLMERAGRGVVEAIFEEWPELAKAPHRAVILCGPGNNGGDGFVIARLLKDAGWEVDLRLLGDPEKLPPDAKANHDRWRTMGPVLNWLEDAYEANNRQMLLGADLVVDAVFGTGLTRPLGPLHNDMWQAFDLDTGAIARMVAVDIPSGLCADSGRALGIELEDSRGARPCHAFQAELTVTFHRMKAGHVLQDGPRLCGRVRCVDIGLIPGRAPRNAWRLKPDALHAITVDDLPQLSKRGGHKFDHGHVLILSGGPGHTGAARLAARGALRIGAGLVTLGVPPAAQQEAAAQLTAIMLKRVGDVPALTKILDDTRINAVCLGPALGLGDDKSPLIEAALKSGRPMVLDADALTLIAQSDDLFAKLHETCVLTPHAGEFARLFPGIAQKLSAPATKGPAYSKADATRAAAAQAGCTVLFKAPDTVIASPNGPSVINSSHYERAAPQLATAGSGDVLAGFITGLLARGFTPQTAAKTGAWLHTECARAFGAGLIAEDLPEALPAVLRSLAG